MAHLMLSVMGAFAEFERALIKERQRAGIAIAKSKGLYRGRKKALSIEPQDLLKARVAQGEKKSDLAREFHISRETLYKYLRSLRHEEAPTSMKGEGIDLMAACEWADCMKCCAEKERDSAALLF